MGKWCLPLVNLRAESDPNVAENDSDEAENDSDVVDCDPFSWIANHSNRIKIQRILRTGVSGGLIQCNLTSKNENRKKTWFDS